MQCPKCQYTRSTADATPDYQCPQCGIIYAKWNPAIEVQRDALRARSVAQVTTGDGKSNKHSPVLILIMVAAVFVVAFSIGGHLPDAPASGLQDIHRKVSEDAVQQYQMVSRNGSAMDRCVHAGLVVATYLQANDERNYQQWKVTQGADCAQAGLPQ